MFFISKKIVKAKKDGIVTVVCVFVYTLIGMDMWKGKQVHSHVYRVPDPFRDEVTTVDQIKLHDMYVIMIIHDDEC